MPPPRIAAVTAAAAAIALAAVVAAQREPPPRQPPFRNSDGAVVTKSLGDLARWRWNAWTRGLPPPPATPVPTTAPDLAFVDANARAGAAMQPAATWIGHATVLVQAGGVNALTDPIFSERASPVSFVGPKRAQPPAVALARLPHVDLVVVSHNHYDHLDAPSVDALARQRGGSPLFVVPLGLKAWFAARGIERVVELDWWQSHRLDGPAGPVDVTLVPVRHWSGRGLTDRLRTLWGGFVVDAGGVRWFHAGDTGWSDDFAEIGRRFAGGVDLALIPIGAYEPRWFMGPQHVEPAESVRIHRAIGARRSLGIHWGTFELTDEPLDEPPRVLADARRAQGVAADDFVSLPVGATLRFGAAALGAAAAATLTSK